MTKNIMSSSEFNKMPYSGTDVSWTKTKGEVEGILYDLREKGLLRKHAWTTEGEAGNEIDTLYMELEIPISDTQLRTIRLKFQPSMIYTEHWKGSVKKGTKKSYLKLRRNTSWRLFWWHFKSKMEAVQYGLTTMESEFMSNIMYRLKDDREITFGDALKMILKERKLELVLEDKRKPKSVEAKVVS